MTEQKLALLEFVETRLRARAEWNGLVAEVRDALPDYWRDEAEGVIKLTRVQHINTLEAQSADIEHLREYSDADLLGVVRDGYASMIQEMLLEENPVAWRNRRIIRSQNDANISRQ